MWHLEGRLIKAVGIKIKDKHYPAQIFTKWTEPNLNAIGIYTITDVREGTLDDNTWEWGTPVIDFKVNTRTFTAVKIPRARLDKEKAKVDASAMESIKQFSYDDINSVMEPWKQRNAITEGALELMTIMIEKGIVTQAEIDARPKAKELLDSWNFILGRRALSDQHEADYKAGKKTVQDIQEELYPEEKI